MGKTAMEICNNSAQAEKIKEEILKSRSTDLRHVIELCDVLGDYAHRIGDEELLGFSYFYKGEAHYILNEVQEMFRSMAQSVAYLSRTGQWALLARAYNMMAITSINRGQAPVAVDYYLLSLKCAEEHGVDSIICSIHINLGYLYMQNGIYDEAQRHFDEAYTLYCGFDNKQAKIGTLMMIYTNLATCYMLRGDMEHAKEYLDRLMQECSSYFTYMDKVYVGCMAARYYHLEGDFKKRDETIQDIMKVFAEKQMPILDLFDDLYSLCELTLEIKNYDVLLTLIKELEPVVSHTGLLSLDRKVQELKISYYDICGKKEEYVKATARFFKLSQRLETESRSMIANMIQVRTALEKARESKQRVEEMNALLTEKSETDALTGLANRYRMTDIFQRMMDECRREQKLLSVEILDIDYFKEYNDNYGHQAGDECICEVAELIKAMQSDKVFCARYGGDEFIIIYKGWAETQVLEQAQKLRENIMALSIEHAYSKALPIVTISQGICQSVPVEENKSWDFLHIADEYLYKVKKRRRNDICAGSLKGECRILNDE